ncbi:hypothetical protein [Terrabacter sp. 2RAF25]|uniref:hypothetical protein n=1 Tax=Terrabacter sp. 2RAF25 TaxID=3232998 RepID=UPI003F9A6790
MSQHDEGLIGEAKHARVADLYLDRSNPRFSARGETDQARIAKVMADNYNAIEIARKIASEGYHIAEPPAVVEEGGHLVVVEGNRRVTALKGLADPTLRATFVQGAEWDRIAESSHRQPPESVHIVVYPTRAAARSLLAHRHIRGILAWDPPEQAKWVRMLIDEDGMTFQGAADLCSKKLSEVRDMYRNSRLIHDDLPGLGIATDLVDERFTVFGNVLANKTLREHARVKSGSDVAAGVSMLIDPSGDTKGLREIVGWVAGDGNHQPLLKDSRKIVKLGQAVAVAEGLAALRSGKSLEEALQVVNDLGASPRENAERMLRAAANSTNRAIEQLENLDDDDDRTDLENLLRHIRKNLTAAEGALYGEND